MSFLSKIHAAEIAPVIDFKSGQTLPAKKVKERRDQQTIPKATKDELIRALAYQMLHSQIILKVLGIAEDMGELLINGFKGLNTWTEEELEAALLKYLQKYNSSFTKKYQGNLNAFVKDRYNKYG